MMPRLMETTVAFSEFCACPRSSRYERANAEQQLEELEEREAKAAEKAALKAAAGLDPMEVAEAELDGSRQ